MSVPPPTLSQVAESLSMLYPPDRLYGLDIETDTRINGLDASVAAIVAVALATSELCEVFRGPEASLLTELNESLRHLPPGVLVTWNGSSFDLPFIERRAAICNVPLDLHCVDHALPRPPSNPELPRRHVRARWGHHRHLDGLRLYRSDVGRALPVSCGLKPMSRLVGMQPLQLDAERLHEYTSAEIDAYVASDASMTRALVVNRWPACAGFIDRLP